MKPPSFRYHAPTTTAEALDALAAAGGDGKVLAGGQSLVPLLNMRLASPGHLVDVSRVAELGGVTVAGGGVRVGASVTQGAVEHDRAAMHACPLLAQALALVAHPVIRNRGTVCGSVAHADPAAELPAVLALLGGAVHVAAAGNGGGPRRRDVPAGQFFLGPLTSALAPDELVEAVTFPALPQGTGSAFVEVARRHGDYALCGVAAAVEVSCGRVSAARVALVSVGPVPQVVDLAEVAGDAEPGPQLWEAAAAAVRRAVDPDSDVHASAGYRRHLAGVLTRRALAEAAARAAAPGGEGAGS